MKIFSNGTFYIGEFDETSHTGGELAALEADSFEIADDSAEALAILAGGTLVINDFGTQDITVTPASSAVDTAIASLQNRLDNDDLDITDLPDIVTVLLSLTS